MEAEAMKELSQKSLGGIMKKIYLASPYTGTEERIMEATKETWKPIKNFPGYDISDYGRVRTWRDSQGRTYGRSMSHIITQDKAKHGGYPSVRIVKNGHYKHLCVHKLVLESFRSERKKGFECRHLDGNPQNNHLDNLAWGTSLENKNDIRRHGGHMNRGVFNGNSKINEKIVAEIKHLLEQRNLSQSRIAKQFKISQPHVCGINKNRYWVSND